MSAQFDCQKIFLFQTIQFIQTVLILLIQFSISTDLVYTLLNVKTVLYMMIQFSVSTVLMPKTVPFQRIQFCISTHFKYGLIVKNISISSYSVQTNSSNKIIQFSIRMQLVLFNPQIERYQVQPFRTRVDPGAMAMEGYSGFLKVPASLETQHQLFQCYIRTLIGVGSYPTAELQSVYSTAPADWARIVLALNNPQRLTCHQIKKPN